MGNSASCGNPGLQQQWYQEPWGNSSGTTTIQGGLVLPDSLSIQVKLENHIRLSDSCSPPSSAHTLPSSAYTWIIFLIFFPGSLQLYFMPLKLASPWHWFPPPVPVPAGGRCTSALGSEQALIDVRGGGAARTVRSSLYCTYPKELRAGVLQIRAGEVLSGCAAEREQSLPYPEVGSPTRMDFAVSNYRLVAPGKCRGGCHLLK